MKRRATSAQIRFMDRLYARYGTAVIVVGASILLRLALSEVLGDNVTYITFYPAVMLAAIVGGFWPGMLAALLSGLVVDYWLLPPFGEFVVSSAGDALGLVLFSFMSMFMSSIAELYRRASLKAAEYEKKSALCESEEQLRVNNQRLELLSDTASQLLLTEDPQGLIQSLCERIMTALGCDLFFNFLVDESRGCLHLNAFAGIPEEVGKSIEWLDYGAAVCGCVARDGCRIVAENIFNNPDPRTDLVKSYGVQAYVCNPLLAQGGCVIGTLSFGSKSKTSFAEDEINLMKTVADQVAIAMERIRLLNVERQRVAELQTIMDAVPAAVWIAHDSECRKITCNRAAHKLLRLPTDANSSKSAPENERPISCNLKKNGEEIPPDNIPLQRAVKGEFIQNFELDLVFEDGIARHLLGNAVPLLDEFGKPRGSIAAFVDITEHKLAEEALLASEAHKQDFYRKTILAATDGKLLISEPENIEAALGQPLASWEMDNFDDVGIVREAVVRLASNANMDESRIYEFVGCVLEAAGNSVKHASYGKASLHHIDDRLIFVVSDSGPGIGTMALPDVALTMGYSTAGTLGMGYKLMLRFCDKVYLATGPEGTTVAIEMKLHQDPNVYAPGVPFVKGW